MIKRPNITDCLSPSSKANSIGCSHAPLVERIMKDRATHTESPKEVLAAERPIIEHILKIASVPGFSVGISHNGGMAVDHFGHRDFAANLRPDSDTRHNIDSLTKGFVAVGCSLLVKEGKAAWTTLLSDVFPEFATQYPANAITIEDLCCHRTTYNAPDGLALQDHNVPLLSKEDVIPVFLQYVGGASQSFRTAPVYSNYGSCVLGLLIERLSGECLEDFLQKRIFKPLGMHRTTTLCVQPGHDNNSRSYSVLADGSHFEIPLMQNLGGDRLWVGASGMKSTLSDLMKYYDAFLAAGAGRVDQDHPLAAAKTLIRGRSFFLGADSVRESSYALGWFRSELPTKCDSSMNTKLLRDTPLLGRDAPSRICIFHQGYQPGSNTMVMSFPETNTVIVTLQSSDTKCNCTAFVSQHLVQAMFQHKVRVDFVKLAEEASDSMMSLTSRVKRELESKRTQGTVPSLSSLGDYAGKYLDRSEKFHIDVRFVENETRLEFRFQGREDQLHALEHYHRDTFSWAMTHDDAFRRARDMYQATAEHYLFDFVVLDGIAVGLKWVMWSEACTLKEPVYFTKQ